MDDDVLPRLLVVRGPSGSGKSTVARLLFERAVRPVCLVEQDRYRFMFRPAGGGSAPNSSTIHRMIDHDVRTALADGYDVILEGILTERSYGELIRRLLADLGPAAFLYSFDLDVEETLRRHRTRSIDARHTEDDMREWHPHARPWQCEQERVIGAAAGIEETVARITAEMGLL